MKMTPKAAIGFAVATIIAGVFSIISGIGDIAKAKEEEKFSEIS